MALLMVGAGLVVVLTTHSRYTDPERVRAGAEAYLQQFVHGSVKVGSAGFSWWEGIRLGNVTVAEAGADTPDRRSPEIVFACREVKLTHDLIQTALGRLTIKSIVALEPTCRIIRSAADGGTNLAGLLHPIDSVDPASPVALPTIELRNARVSVVDRDAGVDRLVDELTLTVRARPSRQGSGRYDLVWKGGGTRAAQGHSQIDLETGRVRNVWGGLPWMSIEAVMIVLNTRYDAAGTWSDLLGLGGIVRARDYNLGEDSETFGPRSVTIELDDASLSIPIDEHERPLPADQRYLRFEHVFGTATLTTDDIDAEFNGLFHGSACHVSAKMRGGVDRLMTLDDLGFDVRLAVEQLRLPRTDPEAPPEHQRFIKRWPALVNFFRDYDPHGMVDVQIDAAKRAGPDEPVVARNVVLTARGGDASCRFFPYRTRHLTGSVEFTPAGVFLRELRGEHDEGVVTVDGWLSGSNSRAAAELTITGTGILIDDALCRAISGKYRRIRDLFRAEGRLDAALTLKRPAGNARGPAKWQPQTRVSFENLSVNHVDFPYPVRGLSGTLVADGNRLQVTDIVGRAGDAQVGGEGTVVFGADEPVEMDLSVWGNRIALDDGLISALPDSLADRVVPFHPSGRFDIQASLATEPGTETVTYASNLVLTDTSIEHEAFPIMVENIHGRLKISPESIVVEDVAGRYQGAVVSAAGLIDRADPPRDTNVTIQFRDLVIDEPLRAASPARLRQVLAEWRIEGPVAADVFLGSEPDGEGAGLTVQTEAWIDGAIVRHDRFPLPFEDVRARITFDEQGVHVSGVEARYGPANLLMNLETRETSTGTEGTITLTVSGLPLDHSLREVMPEEAKDLWDRLGIAGRVDLQLDQLRYRRESTDAVAIWSVEGRAELHDVVLSKTVEVDKISGTVTGEGLLRDRLGGTALSGRLDLSTMKLLGREATAVTSPWSFTRVRGGEGHFGLDAVQGEIYDGSLTAQVEVTFGSATADYELTTVVHNMSIGPFVNARTGSRPGADASWPARGFADARLHLSGVVGDPPARRGGGRVEIVDGHLYRLPIMLAILHVINLSVPEESAFHTAEADFFVTGNRLELKDILLRGNVLALAGSGAMSLPDQGVDLNLVNVSPHRWARVPGLTDFVEDASRELVELHVTGPLAQPTVRPRPLRRLSEELERLFQKKKPKKMQAAAP